MGGAQVLAGDPAAVTFDSDVGRGSVGDAVTAVGGGVVLGHLLDEQQPFPAI